MTHLTFRVTVYASGSDDTLPLAVYELAYGLDVATAIDEATNIRRIHDTTGSPDCAVVLEATGNRLIADDYEVVWTSAEGIVNPKYCQ